MALNDHFLKAAYPGLVTGKLSDFAGVFYFPIFFCAVILFFQTLLTGRARKLSLALILISIFVTDDIMVALKLVPEFSKALEFFFATYLFEIRITNDPWDLLALSMNCFSFLYLKKWSDQA
ncbi:MAG: hypothetical protein AB7F59_07850 [Bdellovibrionales bacterium]